MSEHTSCYYIKGHGGLKKAVSHIMTDAELENILARVGVFGCSKPDALAPLRRYIDQWAR